MQTYLEYVVLGALAGALWPGLLRKLILISPRLPGNRDRRVFPSWYSPGICIIVYGCLSVSVGAFFFAGSTAGGYACICLGVGFLLGAALPAFH